MEITFNGKRALVTGASQGIGRDIAIQLAKCGAKVVALARNKDLLVSLKEEVPSIEYYSVDLADWTATRNVLEKVGDVDLLVNNAGQAIYEPLEKVTEDHVDQLFNINVKAVINITQYVATNLKSRNVKGSIVNVSSRAGLLGVQDLAVYGATKGAVDAFTRAVAKEYGPFGIRANSVNPTVIMTAMGKLGWSDPAKSEPLMERIPLKRFAEVREVTDAVLYLLSDKSTMITAASLPIDGGCSST